MIALTTRKLTGFTPPQLKSLYKKAKKAYYNETPIMSDASFDLLEDYLKDLDPSWSGFKTGAPVAKNIKRKVRLPIPMFSLNKAKPESVDVWLGQQGQEKGVVSLKADGASLELIYEKGVPVQAITRGDGVIGGDVSYLIPHMRIPQKVGTASFIVRCEAIFTGAAFSKYKRDFDAPRNAASGLLNRQDVHVALKDLSIVVLQVLKPNPKPSEGLRWAKAKGFTVIPHKIIPDLGRLDGAKLTKLLQAQKAKAKFQIDGLVVTIDKVNPLPKAGNPSWAIAFKMTQEGLTTTVRAVNWDVSHLGTLTPTIEYDPIDWEGSKLSQATAFNAKYVLDNKIGPGTQVRIQRSGEIIPYISQIIKATKASVPKESQFGPYHVQGVHFVLDNPKANDTFRIKRMARFFSEMGADFMREKTVAKLFAMGFTNLSKMLKAKPEAFEGEGISAAGAVRLHQAIHKVIDGKTLLTKLMVASATFPRGMGERRFQSLGQAFEFMALSQLPAAQQVRLISAVHGWNTKTAEAFVAGMPKFLKWLDMVKVPYINDTGLIKKVRKGVLNGVGVTWTGYRDQEQERTVIDNGGEVVPFGGRTTVLLYAEGGKASSKVTKAEQKGVPTMTWVQFGRRYKFNGA